MIMPKLMRDIDDGKLKQPNHQASVVALSGERYTRTQVIDTKTSK
jgi:hypothetical protein